MNSNNSEHPVDIYGDSPCLGANLPRLLHPAILTILAGRKLHGYAIVERLARTPTLSGERPDPTGVYRTLSAMEECGFVTSAWDTSGSGPPKKIYTLTPQGHKCLTCWIDTLLDYHKAVGRLLANARKASARLKPSHRSKEKR